MAPLSDAPIIPISLRDATNPSAPPRILRISNQQYTLINAYLEHGTYKDAAKVAEMSLDSASTFLNSPFVSEYLLMRLTHITGKIGLTPEKVLYKINELLDGSPFKKIDPGYVRLIDVASKITNLIRPVQTINVNHKNEVIEDPMKSLSAEDLDRAILARIKETNPDVLKTPTQRAVEILKPGMEGHA